VYCFTVSAQPNGYNKEGEPGYNGYGRAEDFALDYLAALGQPITK